MFHWDHPHRAILFPLEQTFSRPRETLRHNLRSGVEEEIQVIAGFDIRPFRIFKFRNFEICYFFIFIFKTFFFFHNSPVFSCQCIMGAGALIVISLNVVGHSSESGRNNMMERWRHKTGNETSMAASSDPITNSNEIRTWDLNVNLNVEPSHRDRNFSAARPTAPDARAELRKSKRSNLLFYHSLGSTHDTTNRHGWILSFKSTQTRTACSTTRFRIHKHFCFEFST